MYIYSTPCTQLQKTKPAASCPSFGSTKGRYRMYDLHDALALSCVRLEYRRVERACSSTAVRSKFRRWCCALDVRALTGAKSSIQSKTSILYTVVMQATTRWILRTGSFGWKPPRDDDDLNKATRHLLFLLEDAKKTSCPAKH